jgi:hypothetical protein
MLPAGTFAPSPPSQHDHPHNTITSTLTWPQLAQQYVVIHTTYSATKHPFHHKIIRHSTTGQTLRTWPQLGQQYVVILSCSQQVGPLLVSAAAVAHLPLNTLGRQLQQSGATAAADTHSNRTTSISRMCGIRQYKHRNVFLQGSTAAQALCTAAAAWLMWAELVSDCARS